MKWCVIVLCFIKLSTAKFVDPNPTPIVMWHGMGDTCCVAYSIGGFKYFLEKLIPGVYVISLRIGKSTDEDLDNGYFMNGNDQVESVCKTLAADSKLQNGFNAIGFSQGGLLLRAVVQRCGHKIGPVKNLITFGSQHQGIFGISECGALTPQSCDYVKKLLKHAAYYNWVQRSLVLGSYWHDPLMENLYKNNSIFLADINNELTINKIYIDNLNKLEHFVMIMFMNDTVVQPKESAWFGFFKPGQANETQTLQESALYKEDRLGLKKMDEAGKLVFLTSPGNHLRFSLDWLVKEVIKPYLKRTISQQTNLII